MSGRGPFRAWSPEDHAAFLVSWADVSQTIQNIAAALGRSRTAVRLRAREFGLPYKERATGARKWNPELIEEARRMFVDQGLTATAVGRHFGVGRSAITSLSLRFGWGKRERLGPETKSPAPPKRPRREEHRFDLRKLKKVPPPRGSVWEPLPDSKPRPWLERAPCACKWPVGGEGAEMLMCCLPAPKGPYCDAHRAIAYAKPVQPAFDRPSFIRFSPRRAA